MEGVGIAIYGRCWYCHLWKVLVLPFMEGVLLFLEAT